MKASNHKLFKGTNMLGFSTYLWPVCWLNFIKCFHNKR